MVKALVELHGGRVEVRSDRPGLGSEFTVRLPAAKAPGAASPVRVNGPTKRHPSRRILVVDDNRDGADILARYLRRRGYEVQTAYDGLKAVQAAAAFRLQVVLLDIGLPKLNAYEAAAQIRRQPWGLEMVLSAITGWGQEGDKRRAREAGFDHHLTKPVDPVAVEELLAGLDGRPA